MKLDVLFALVAVVVGIWLVIGSVVGAAGGIAPGVGWGCIVGGAAYLILSGGD